MDFTNRAKLRSNTNDTSSCLTLYAWRCGSESYVQIRNHLNLRTDKHSQHWAASPKISTAGETGEREDCVLLRRPVTAVRGLLALARREAESGW